MAASIVVPVEKATREMDLELMADKAAGWFDELRGPLRRYLICSGASTTDADDAVQETFLRLHRHLGRNGDGPNLYGGVLQVLVTIFAMSGRARGAKRR